MSAPNPPKPPVGRRLTFLAICLFGYVLLLAGWWLVNKSGPAGGQTRVVIVVMPFAGASNDAVAKQAAMHLAPDVAVLLIQNPALRVVTAGEGPPENEQAARDLGKRMKANAVLTGTVSSAGHRVRVTSQLVDSETGYHVWEHAYVRDPQDAQGMAQAIANSLVNALQGKRE